MKEYVSLNVTRDTRQLAKYISAITGSSVHEVMAAALKALQEKLNLQEPPNGKLE